MDEADRVVDLMGHTGCQETDACQLFTPYHLAGTLLDLLVQFVVDLLEVGGHLVHRAGQLGDLVVGIQFDPVVKISSGHPAGAGDQDLERPHQPLVEQPDDLEQGDGCENTCYPGEHDQGPVLHSHLARKLVHPLLQVSR